MPRVATPAPAALANRGALPRKHPRKSSLRDASRGVTVRCTVTARVPPHPVAGSLLRRAGWTPSPTPPGLRPGAAPPLESPSALRAAGTPHTPPPASGLRRVQQGPGRAGSPVALAWPPLRAPGVGGSRRCALGAGAPPPDAVGRWGDLPRCRAVRQPAPPRPRPRGRGPGGATPSAACLSAFAAH